MGEAASQGSLGADLGGRLGLSCLGLQRLHMQSFGGAYEALPVLCIWQQCYAHNLQRTTACIGAFWVICIGQSTCVVCLVSGKQSRAFSLPE